jgi:hypothetical protein
MKGTFNFMASKPADSQPTGKLTQWCECAILRLETFSDRFSRQRFWSIKFAVLCAAVYAFCACLGFTVLSNTPTPLWLVNSHQINHPLSPSSGLAPESHEATRLLQ